MKFKELTKLSKEEREKKLSELKMELIKLNTQVATGTPPKDAGIIKRIKKDIAKILMINGRDQKITEMKNSTDSKKPIASAPKAQQKAEKKEEKNTNKK